MRYIVTFENGEWFVRDIYRNKVIDCYETKETANRVATLFENINLLSRKDDDLK